MSRTTVFRWTLRVSIWIWVLFWIAQIFVGDLGASPALKLNHEMGEISLWPLTLNLVIGMALDWVRPFPARLRWLLLERRFWGVSSFLILCFHVGFYFLNESFETQAWVQLVTKTYLIFALASFLILFVLALTSNDFSVRRLGAKRWRKIHRAVYLAQLLLFGHVLLIEKADLIKYGIWLGALAALQLARLLLRAQGWRKMRS